MATVVNFHGKKCIEPGSYAATVYNPTSVVNVATFGNVMIIDTGLSLATVNGASTEFAGGAGVNGENAKGLKSVYEFTTYEDFVSFMGGGIVADIAQKIFTPIEGVIGAPKLYYARAATTTSAKITLTISVGNTLVLACKNEGLCGNGIEVDSVLKVGYAAKVIAGDEAGKYKLQIYRGTFAGEDASGESYGAKTLANAQPILIFESADCATLQDLFDAAKADSNVTANFVVSTTGTASTAIAAAISQTLATGGTTAYLDSTEYDDVLEAIEELDVTFFLCANKNASDGKGVDAATNVKLFTFLKNSAKFNEFMIVPGGEKDDDLFAAANSSKSIAEYFNDEQVITIHGAPVVPRKDGNGTKQLPSIYLAADMVGLNAGFPAQTPLTFKRIGYQGFAYDLKRKERERALQCGIMHVRNVSNYWCINQGITTLQDNKKTISDSGDSFELSVALIKAQLNKELIIEGQKRFTGNTVAQSSPEDVKNFVETKLSKMVASTGNDNLIISWKNVKVTAVNSDYTTTYDFVPNVPVNKTFFVGNMLDFTF